MNIRRASRPWRALAGGLAACAAVLLCDGCSSHHDEATEAAAATPRLVTLTPAQLQRVRLFTVAPATFHKSIEASGVVDFDNDQATSVLAPMSGPVARLLVQPGQMVRAGQPLAAVDSPDYASAVSTYRKALATARNARRIAEADKDLAQHNGVSMRESQQAESDAAGAEADRDAALQALVALRLSPQAIRDIQQGRAGAIEGEIRAPIAGTVAEKLITPGQLLQAGTTPAFTIANLSKMWVMAQISASDLASVRVGDLATVETGGAPSTVSGVVDNIGALVNPDTRAVMARVVVPNPGGVLKKQMYVRLTLQSRQASTGLLVPVSAVLRDEENLPFVYVAEAGGGFARRHVSLGDRLGDQYEIPEGLKAGDRLVVDGALFIQFMQSQ